MTALTYDLDEAIRDYWAHVGAEGWISFRVAYPYAHWLIEVTTSGGDEGIMSIIRPIANNNGNDEVYTYWRPYLKQLQ